MERAIYADGVLVDNTMLNRTEMTKAQEILRGRTDWTSRGVYSGGKITVAAADNTKVDIAAFSGFVPMGEFIECTGNLASVQLSSSTLGAINYVCAFYTELEDFNQPHETDGNVYPTRAKGSYRVRVYTEAEYDALPATNPTLAIDARDRALVLGHVTANGSSVALTSASIASPTNYSNILYSTPRVLETIAGVEVLGVSSGTPTGAGTMAFTYAASVYRLQWTPNGGTAGATVDISTDGDYQIYDSGALEYIKVKVVASQLPMDASLSETLIITDIYYQAIPRQTGEDTLHRNLIGSGVSRPENPHGLSLDDLSGETLSLLDEHQDVMHCNGIWKGSSAAALSTAITHVSPEDVLTIVAPTGSDLYYINGKKLKTIDKTSIPFDFPTHTSHLYEIFLTGSASVQTNLKVSFPLSRTVTGVWVVDTFASYPAGAYDLECVVAASQATFTFSWDGGQEVVVPKLTTDRAIRLFAEDGVNWIDLWVHSAAMGATDSDLPAAGATYTDTLTVAASPAVGTNLIIGTVVYWYDSVALVGRLGYPPYNGSAGLTIDRRSYGTLCEDNINDQTLQDLIYAPLDEYQESGVLLGRDLNVDSSSRPINFSLANASGLGVDVLGGHAYCRGQRLEVVKKSVTLNASVTSVVYVDADGAIQTLDVSASFGGSVAAALQYLLGCSTDRPSLSGLHRYDDVTPFDIPERGVPLWEVHTDATSITASYDLMRNVGVRPWTVAERSSKYAAFDSLYTAFKYASVLNEYNKLGDVEIVVVGATEVNRTIVQPGTVSVKGVGSSGVVSITSANTSGTWQLSTGCKIATLKITTDVATTATLAVSTDCVISKCLFSAASYHAGVYNFVETGSVGSVDDLIIEDCEFEYMSAVFGPDFVSSSSGRGPITFRGNSVTANTANTDTNSKGLVAFRSGRIDFSNNYVSSVNSSSNQQAAVYLAPNGMATVDSNYILVGEASSSGPVVVGLEMTSIGASGVPVSVVNNIITSTSIWCTGIKFGSTNTSSWLAPSGNISHNKLGDTGTGIYLADGLKDLIVSENTLQGCDYRGIYVEDNTSDGVESLSILNNTLSGASRTATVTNLSDNGLYGIWVTDATGGGALTDILINANIISDYTNSIGALYGVYVYVAAFSGAHLGWCVADNHIWDLVGNASSVTVAIYVRNAVAATVASSVTVARNDIILSSAVLTSSSGSCIGISVMYNWLVDSNIYNNKVVLAKTNTTDLGTALYLGSGSCGCLVSDNILQGLQYALHTKATGVSVVSGVFKSNCVGIYDEGTASSGINISDVEVYVTSHYGYGGGASLGSMGVYSTSGTLKFKRSHVEVIPVSNVLVGWSRFVSSDAGVLDMEDNYVGPVDDITSLSGVGSEAQLVHVALSATGDRYLNFKGNIFDNYHASGSKLTAVEVESVPRTAGALVVVFRDNLFKASIHSTANWGASLASVKPAEVRCAPSSITSTLTQHVWSGNIVRGIYNSVKPAAYFAASSNPVAVLTNSTNMVKAWDGTQDWW